MQNGFTRHIKVASGVLARRASQMICRTVPTSRSKAARGPSWSLKSPTQLNHARLSWRVLPIWFSTRDHYQNFHPGGRSRG
eukprot:5540149-Pleurochrysis_carterae.AAC.2